MSEAALPGLLVAYAAALVAASWLAERLCARSGRRWAPASPWARREVARFRAGMARIVRLVAAFLLLAVLVRFRDPRSAVPALLLLAALAASAGPASRRAARRERDRTTPTV